MAENKKKGESSVSKAAGQLGKVGGPARARVLTATRRKEIAAEGGRARSRGAHKQRTKK